MFIRLKTYFLILFFTLLYHFIFSQDVHYKHFSIESGLPSSSIYDLYEDKFGFLWFATETGLCKFDGIKFENFTISDGIPQLPFVRITQTAQEDLVFISRNGLIYLYNFQRYILHPQSFQLSKMLENEIIDNLVCGENNIFYASTSKGNVFKIEKDRIIQINRAPASSNLLFFMLKGRQYLWGKLNERNTHLKEELNIIHQGDSFIFKLPFRIDELNHKNLQLISLKRSELMISIENRFYHIGSYRNYVHFFRNPLNGILYDKSGNVWISEANNGCYFYQDGKLQEYPEHFLKGKNILKIFQDHENSYWIIVENEGIYFIPSISFRIYPNVPYNIVFIDTFKNNLFFTTYDNKIYMADKSGNKIGKIREVILPNDGNNDLFEDFLCFSDGTFWILRSKIIAHLANKSEKLVDLIATQYKIDGSFPDGKLRAVILRKVRFKDSQIRYFYPKGTFRSKPFSLFEDEDRFLWLHTLGGLNSEKGFDIRYFEIENKDFKIETTDFEFANGINWIGTRYEGLKMIMNTGTILTFGKNSTLNSNFIRDVYIDHDTVVWLGTNMGIDKVNLTTLRDVYFIMNSIKKVDGVPYHEINEMLRDGKIMWAGTSQGLMSFLPERKPDLIYFPPVRFKTIQVNDRDTIFRNSYELEHTQNTLTIDFESVTFKEKNILFRYRLRGLEKKWTITRNNSIRFPKLRPGDYVFEVMAFYSGNKWPVKALKISFSIEKPFYQKFWFNGLVLFSVLMIIVLIIFLIVRNIRKTEERQKNLLMAEISALRSQMNPHFLFNSLNILQDFILDGNFRDSLFCLNDLSRLLRMILEASRFHLILLSKELEIIELFIQLIRLRFLNDFQSEIKFDGIVPQSDIVLPPMIIQPFIENAVFHGLKLKEGDKKLLICFSKINDRQMMVTIEDNGIGREKSQELKKINGQTHRSVGTYNIFDRIKLINQLQEEKIKCEIIDLHDENGQPAGTKVELILPILIKKHDTRLQ